MTSEQTFSTSTPSHLQNQGSTGHWAVLSDFLDKKMDKYVLSWRSFSEYLGMFSLVWVVLTSRGSAGYTQI